MNTYSIKIRRILPVFLYISLGTLIGLALIRYFLAIQMELLDFKLEIWELWIPLAFPWIPITIWLRPRLRILSFKSDTDRRQFIFQILAWIAIAVPLLISQSYLTTATGKIQDADNIAELDKKEITRYYRIKSFQTVSSKGASYTDVRAAGKNDDHLNINIYFVCPIVSDTLAAQPAPFKYWYGVSFRKQISNSLSVDEKEAQYNDFYDDCLEKMNHYAFHDVTYFERLPNTEDRDGYLKAVANRTKEEPDAVILEPKYESFEHRTGNKLPWIFGSYLVGTMLFLLLLLWPGVNSEELQKQLAGKKPEEDDIIDMLKFLVPRKPHLVTALVLDLNILVFLVMIFSGIHIVSPNGSELLEWGANRRTEVLSGEWWRLLTSTFVHGGVMHLILNIYALVLASIFIEPVIGSVRYAIIYFVSGIAGSIASIWWYDNTVSVGASGAIFGLFGAILAVTFTGLVAKGSKKMILALFGPYVALNLVMGLFGGIDNAAHIGGLVSGAVVALIVCRTLEPEADEAYLGDDSDEPIVE